MHINSISVRNDQPQKILLKQSQSYSNNGTLNSQNLYSTHSLSILSEEKTSFALFIAKEKDNLQFFPSFRKTKKITKNNNDKTYLMRNVYFLPRDIPNDYCAALNISPPFDKKNITTKYMTHLSKFALNTSSNILYTKRTRSMIENLENTVKSVTDMNRKRRLHCIERYIRYMNDDQTKAAVCFILQLNTYINQRILLLQKESTDANKYCEQSSKFINSTGKINERNTNTTSIFDFISKSNLNDVHRIETNDSIDISMQLSDNSDCSSQVLLNKNDDLLAFYNQNILSNDFSVDSKTNINNIIYSLSEKEEKIENQQISITTIDDRSQIINRYKSRTVDCSDLMKYINKTDHDADNHVQIQATSVKDKKFPTNTSSKCNTEMAISIFVPKIVDVANIVMAPLERTGKLMRVTSGIEMTDPIFERTKINIHQQTIMSSSLLTNYNYNTSESPADLQNLIYESNEKNPSISLHSQCLVSFEFANQEEHRIEVIELPRSSHRIARVDTYNKIRGRLTVVNLMNIDLTALLRTILQSDS